MRLDTDFTETLVVPRLSAPHPRGKNIIYCATFRMAWQALCRRVGSPVELEDVQDFLLKELALPLPDGLVDDASALSWVGLGESADLEGLYRDVEQRGGERPNFGAPGPDMLFVYSLLSKALAFPVVFHSREGGLHFGRQCVEAFGMEEDGSEEDLQAMARQVLVHHYAGPHEAVLELVTTQPDDRVLIAKIEPGRTLKATVDRALSFVRDDGTPITAKDKLSIPCIDVAISRVYQELAGRKLKNAGCAGWLLAEAQQETRFRLDARGATVQSVALLGAASAISSTRAFYFTQPFIVLLVRRGCDEPYLAIWVQTPELLVPHAE